MRVILRTHGGLAAAINPRLPPRVVDTDELPPSKAAELGRLVAAADNKTDKSAAARDAMSYAITVEEDGKDERTITGNDAAMSPSFAALLDWLQRN